MSARESAQAARRQVEERLQAIIDNAPSAISVKHTLGPYVLANREFARLAGLPREEVAGKTDLDLFTAEEAASFAASDEKVCAARAPMQLEETLRRGDEVRTLFTIKFPLCDAAGLPYAVCAIATDITEHKRSKERLRQSEERFSLLVAGVQDYGIVMLDPGGRVESWNEGAQRLYGFSGTEIIGRKFSRFYPPDEVAAGKAQSELRAAAELGRVEDEGWRVRRDGSRFLANSILTAVRDEAGQLRGFAKMTRDVTERKFAERKLLRAKEQAEQANEAKSVFLSRMSHELRTPLNAILGFGQLLELDELGGDQGESVQHILRAGEHLLHLVNEVLDLGRIENGDTRFEPERVCAAEVVEEAFALVKHEAARLSVALSAQLDSAPDLAADRQRLKQVLINLIANAVKYNREAGTVEVWGEPTADGRYRIYVRDTGHGLSEEQMGRLFTPFDRLGAEERGIAGTGLGLSVSKWMAQAIGGTLEAQSTPGEGSTFTVTLPLAGDLPAFGEMPFAEREQALCSF